MRVSWTEYYTPNDVELDWYPDAHWDEMDKHYSGELIGSCRNIWGYTYLTVACDDGRVRDVEISKVTVKKN